MDGPCQARRIRRSLAKEEEGLTGRCRWLEGRGRDLSSNAQETASLGAYVLLSSLAGAAELEGIFTRLVSLRLFDASLLSRQLLSVSAGAGAP